ncbi:acyl transferase domain-containing protein [Kickxella alabastrina]|uniref:acyl transferase domain-containing protein n=1 Tax=Kickxella alabastrina TaxID=61397 RepID=UPI0022201E52|nr:acyl transferase domain-containing protein [Kickxella alabastrina]KAI7825086.1 acyl transferase domain-containing protein [Kickxella alabastrina]
MDFIILSALPSVLQVLSSPVFGDGQLSIVHLYNQLQLADGFSALAIGDSVRSVLEIDELINTPAGKQITLTSTSYVDDQVIATSKCAFLSRGYTTDYALTFQRVRERYITIQMSSAKDIAVLEAKEWFVYCDDPASRPDPMSQLEFYIESLYRFQGTSVYSSIATTGRVLLKRACGPSVHIANVDFEWKGVAATADPVVEYLKRYETRSAAVLFDDGGYQIIPYSSSSDDQMKATVPNSNEEYARLSWDSNPIHTNAYIADVAGLPGTITHGLWTSASTRAIIESCAADDQPERIRAYHTDFVGMVLPDDQLRTELRHTGMVGGRMLIKGQTFNATGNAILECTAEVAQPKTAYVFTGQGSQEVGMGMLLYEQSAAARGVWDRADAHMAATYGVSLLEIVRKNPEQITVHFGGKTGESIRRNYMLLERIDHSQSSKGVWVPIFPEITSDSTSYTFQMHTGLLNATQFTQVAIIVLGVAVIADIQSRGLMSHDSAFGGHSLGEYSALAAMCGMFTMEEIVDVVFYRGMMMQSAVERDEEGRSQYGMVAVNPSRVKKSFNEALLVHAVSVISVRGQGLLEVVNYNVDSHQYVVAGTLAQLAVLRLVLDSVAAQELSFDLNYSDGEAKSFINLIVSSVLAQAIDSKPRQGRASIPLAGIDVPFHSSLLLPGVPSFRALLTKIIHARNVDYALLHKRYIPNLTAVPFEVSKQYFELVLKLTESPVVSSILDSWCDSSVLNNDDNEMRHLATKLVIELLAYQFASPVQWIKTQDQLFGNVGVRRLVEVGVSPILCGMSAKTLDSMNASAGARAVQVALLHIERDRDSIYYLGRADAGDSNLDKIAKLPGALPVPPAAPAPVPATAEEAQPASTEARADNTAAVAEVPLNALEVVHAIVAHKIKRKLEDVSVKRSIKELVGGKSTLQNEIIGDLHNEFNGKVPDKVEDIPLSDVAAAIGVLSGAQLGPYSTSMVTRLFSSKMPGGFSLSAARAHLQTSYGLGPQRQNALLLTALTMEPSERLADEKGSVAWLGSVASTYAASAGISYAAATAASAAGGSSKQLLGPAISSAAMESIQQKQRDHIVQQIEVLARYAGLDLRQDARLANKQLGQIAESQSKLAQIRSEFGDELVEGVQPCFDVRKVRRFDSFWNWARQQAFEAIQRAIVAARDSVANAIAAADNVAAASNAENKNAELAHRLRNCAHPELVQMLSGMAAILESSGDAVLSPALKLARKLHALCAEALARPPVYVEMSQPMQPQTIVSPSGTVSYAEIPRANEPTFAEFVAHMRKQPLPIDEKLSADTVLPFIHIRQKSAGTSGSSGNNEQWLYSDSLSDTYFGSLSDMCSGGLSFAGKIALVTGCGNGSIGADIVRGLLSGGARVVATTSHFNRKSAQFFEDLYRTSGTRGSELILVPFNQGSINDIGGLVDYIYNDTAGSKGLGWDLDYVFPFAAVSDVGSFATSLGSHSEFAQRVMLTNVLRLMGGIKAAKEQRKYISRPSLVVLPLSPNQGIFGGDGLYGECKAGLETAFNRWKSESWKGYLSIAGAVIGWTRGTGLMSANNLVTPEIEKHGVRTFSTREMAFSILGLLHPYICRAVHRSPIWADISGGINNLQDVAQLLASAQRDIDSRTRTCRAISLEAALDSAALSHKNSSAPANVADLSALADHKHQFPAPKSYNELHHLVALQGMVNLDKVVVITGYGEVGPYGNAETRWEMEAFGQFSVEGCIELAWIMGLIKHSNSVLPATDQIYVGWVDAKTGEPVRDIDIKPRYEEYILAHTGTRLIEPELCDGYDTSKKHVLREIQIDSDMAPFEASTEAAAAYKQSNGDRVDIWENPGGGGSWSVRFLKGALIRVPAAVRANRLVAGQLPTGWSAAHYGIPENIIKQVDTITLYTLVATVEALVRSGITDPYELYQHFHVSEVGSTTGSGIGGMKSVVDTFRNRYLDMELNNDTIQESFISTLQAWVNMLLISGSGPVKPVVGACATAVLSIDSAVETIQMGKARFMIAGGAEALSEVSSTEFSNMGATGNSLEEIISGREPAEMCRPCTSTRNGFMESQGAGIVTLMSASAAIEIGAPIYGIVAMSSTATDKQGRSVPAPGQGVLTSAREIKSNDIAPQRLSLDYRRRQIKRQIAVLNAWKEEELAQIPEYTAKLHSGSEKLAAQYMQQLEIDYARQVRGVQDVWGVDFWKQDTEISPLRGSLAVWGLTANDIGMASFHGTSTVANDKNESDVFNAKLQHIGRAPGHVVPVVCQKWLTGHPKGPAASFMLNGVIQSMRTGLVPGNRNADNISSELRAFDYALYLSKTVQTSGIKAALLTSFGFGQVGGELLIVHPDYLLATISREQLDEYNAKLKRREAKSYRYWQDMLVGRHLFVQVKGQPPYTAEQERRVYLDPLARAHYDAPTGQFKF